MRIPITAQDIAAFPPPGGGGVSGAVFSPNGAYVSCLWSPEGAAGRDVWLYNRVSGDFTCLIPASEGLKPQDILSYDEIMARELARDRWYGLARTSWLPDSSGLLAVCSSQLLRCTLAGQITGCYRHDDYIAFIALSPDGAQIAFHAAGDLWLIDSNLVGPARRLTQRPDTTSLNGVADKVTREEIFNQRAFWWSKDGTSLYFARYHLAQVPVVCVGNGLQDDDERIAYSCPGDPVAHFSLHQLDLASGQESCLLEGDTAWPYLVGFELSLAGEPLVHRLNRAQTCLQIGVPAPDGLQLWHEERGAPWLNVLGGFTRFAGDKNWLFLHEHTGTGRIAVYRDGQLVRDDIGADCGHVERIVGLTPDQRAVYFCATGGDPRDRHIYKQELDGQAPSERLTRALGIHSVTLSPDRAAWLHVTDAPSHPPALVLESLEGEAEFAFPAAPDARVSELATRLPEFLTLTAADGHTPLYAALYKPHSLQAGTPLLVAVYGGPHVQVVRHSWALAADLRTQRLVEAGFAVLKVDNRGSSGRGIAFEQAVYGRLGEAEVADQVAAVRAILAREPELDTAKVFVSGWSYGGYMALQCLCRYPEVFANGVSGAPVTSWAEYDAQYTERYMGDPQDNRQGYAASMVMAQCVGLRCAPLLIHGMKDENVLFRHSGLLLEELARLNRFIHVLPLPRERHSASGVLARTYVEEQIFSFLMRESGLEPSL